MPIGPRGEPLPYPPGMGAGRGPDMPPMNPGMGVGPGPDRPPQMPPIEAVVARIQELQAELQQLVSLAEQMGGMGAGRGPDLPPGIPANGGAGIQATNAAMGVGGPPGLLG